MATFLQTDFLAFGAGNIGALSKNTIEDLSTTAWVHDGAASIAGISAGETSGSLPDNIQKLSIDGYDCLRLTIKADGSPCCYNGNRAQINISLPNSQNEVWENIILK